ncbi:MAG: hypothetical protein WDN29_05700 [Methylovirgula sp.]
MQADATGSIPDRSSDARAAEAAAAPDAVTASIDMPLPPQRPDDLVTAADVPLPPERPAFQLTALLSPAAPAKAAPVVVAEAPKPLHLIFPASLPRARTMAARGKGSHGCMAFLRWFWPMRRWRRWKDCAALRIIRRQWRPSR